MSGYYESLSTIQRVFALCALAGGTVFAIRTVLLFMGLTHDLDTDMDPAGDVHAGLADTDVSFHFLTFHGITAFFLMFGMVGLTLSRYHGRNDWLSLAGGVGAGLVTMWLIAWLFGAMRRMQADGTIRLQNAVGQEGVVYLRIPADGIGKVQITIQGGLKIFEARARAGQAAQTGDRVKVVEVTPENTMIVEKVVV